MAIINNCPLSGISVTIESPIDLTTTYLHHIISLSIPELVAIANKANLPNPEFPKETKLLFCAFAKKSNLLIYNRHILNLPDRIFITHFKLLQSLAIYMNKEPKFALRVPKFAHYEEITCTNFGHYLELVKEEKQRYVDDRKDLKNKFKEQSTIVKELFDIDVAETKLGMLASKYEAKLSLDNSTMSMPKELAGYLLVAMQLPTEVQIWYKFLMCGTISALKVNKEAKEIDFITLIEDLENWETGLTVKYAALRFLRGKLEKFNVYQGRKVNKIDISELDFLLGDVGLQETKSFEATKRINIVGINTDEFDFPAHPADRQLSEKSFWAHDGDMIGSTYIEPTVPANSTNSTNSLAAKILAKIAAKKGNTK